MLSISEWVSWLIIWNIILTNAVIALFVLRYVKDKERT